MHEVDNFAKGKNKGKIQKHAPYHDRVALDFVHVSSDLIEVRERGEM